MNLLLIITIIFRINSLRITDPKVTIYNDTFPTYDFIRQRTEIIEIPYGAYPGVFAIDLHKRINGEIDHQSINLGDFEKIEEEELGEYGCFAIQRNIEINMNLKLWLDKTGITQDKYFTDVILAEAQKQAYIVRNDFVVFSVNLKPGLYGMYLNNVQSSFAKQLNYDADQDDYHPFLVKEQNSSKTFIITTNGGVSFLTNQTVNTELIFKNEPEIKKRDRIFTVHYNKKNRLVFVACGHEGIDVYKLKNDEIIFLISYSTENIGNPYSQIIDVNSDGNDKLYILDLEQGLKFFEINQDQTIKYLFLIQITNAQSFDFYKNTFFIVAKTVNKQDYAVEIFVNQVNYDYYINNYYIDEMTINDVNVYDYYAILIGDDGHKIIYHSIYSEFLNQDLISHTSFQEPNLIKTREYEFEDTSFSYSRLIAAIAKYEFQFIYIKMNMPSVKCMIDEVGKYQFYVRINSTNCAEKQKQNNLNYQFGLCNSSQSFSLTTTEIPGNHYTYAQYTITIYILVIVLIWVIVCCYYLNKKWGYKLKYLIWRKKITDATAPYNESFDVKEQELPQTQK